MIDISNGYHLLIQIKPTLGDDWIDHNGNTIGQLGFTTGSPQAVVVAGANMAAVYDADLNLGELSRAFENFPINPLERLADFSFSITGVWSDPDGNINTSNFLWMLEDINRGQGKVLNLIGREVRVIISTTAIPGMIYNPSTQEWEQVGIGAYTCPASSLPGLPVPADPGTYETLASFRIENVKFGGSGRIDFDCTSLHGDVTIGSPVAFAGADQKQIKPIVYGDFTNKLAPVGIEKTLDKISRIHLDEDTLTRFDALMVYDKTNDVEWGISSSINRNGTKIDFSADFDTAYNSIARAANSDSWVVLDSESAVLPTAETPEQKLFTIDDEVVGFHTPKVTSSTIDSVTHPPMVSRGWGGGAKGAHAQNAPYKLVDAVIVANSLVIDVELLPIRIYDASEQNQQGSWDAGSYTAVWLGGGYAPKTWNSTAQAELAGNPWAVIANSKDGGTIENPIIVSTSNTATDLIKIVSGVVDIVGYTRQVTEANLIFEFPDLSEFDGVVMESKILLDASARMGSQVRFDAGTPYDAVKAAWGTSYNKATALTLYTNSTNNVINYVFGHNDYTDRNTTASRTYASTPLDGGDSISQIRLQCLLAPGANGKPYVQINAIKIKAKLKIPITSDLKICSKMLGRLASSGQAGTSAVISDMINRYLGATTNLDFADGHNVSVALTEQTKLRDVLRDLALAGVSAITQSPSGRFVVTQWGTGGVKSLTDADVILGENNQPSVSYSLPIQSSVYSSFEIRYGWDHMREKYTRSLIVNTTDFIHDGIKNDPSLWISSGRGVIMRGWCQEAAGWLGMLSSPFVYESKIIQDSWTAEDMLLRLVEWLTTPRMSLSVKCDWSKTQGIGMLDTVGVVCTGLPARVGGISWGVIAIVDDLKAMERTFTLIERPA